MNHSKDAFSITDHLQWHYKNELPLAFNLENPADCVGVCLTVDYTFRFLSVYDLEEGLAKSICWESLIDLFHKIGASMQAGLLQQLSAASKEADKKKLRSKWLKQELNAVFEKCLTYLKQHIEDPLIAETLDRLPPISSDSALLKAARIADFAQIQECLQNGDNPNATDKDGYTPLQYVVYEYKRQFSPPKSIRKAISLLLKAGAHPDAGGNRELIRDTVTPPDPSLLKELLKHGWDVNDLGKDGTAVPLVMEFIRLSQKKPFRKGDDRLAKKGLDNLLMFKPDLNLVDPTSKLNPLCIANSDELRDQLLASGARLNFEVEEGFYLPNPFTLAVFNGDWAMAQSWLAKGAELNSRLAYRFKEVVPAGSTSLDVARLCKHQKIQAELEKAGAIPGEPVSWLIQLTGFRENAKVNEAFLSKAADTIHNLIFQSEYIFAAYSDKKYLSRSLKSVQRGFKIQLSEHSDKAKTELISQKLNAFGIEIQIL